MKKIWILIPVILVLILVGYLLWQTQKEAKKESAETPSLTPKTPVTTPQTTQDWKTYQIIPAAEEAAEERQAVGFSLKYPKDWNYKILDEEIRREGAPVYDLHFVAFSDQPVSKITLVENRIVVFANAHLFADRLEIEMNNYGGKKATESKLPSGEKVAKFGGEKVSPLGPAGEETVTVLVEPPADWTLVIEGKKADEGIIDQMVESLKF